MPEDLFTIKKTAYLLNERLVGAKINKIIQPTPDEVVLTLYNKKVYNLVINTTAKFCRVALSSRDYVSPLTPPNFCMLLRKYILQGEITKISSFEEDRIIAINIVNLNDFHDQNEYVLYAEIMGKYSNAFLTQNDILMGALKSSPQSIDSGRITLNGAKYLFPLKQDKINPYDKNKALAVLNGAGDVVTGTFILNNFLGFAPVTANEIAYLMNGEKIRKTAEGRLEVLSEFLKKPLNPVVIRSQTYSDALPFNYLHIAGEREYFDDFLTAKDVFYSSAETEKNLSAFKNSLLQKINAFEKKEFKKLTLLLEREQEAENADKFKLYGELLTANLYKVKKGDEFVEVLNYYDGTTLKIPLDKTQYPNANAQKYYKKYNKLKTALEIVKTQKEQVASELNYAKNLKFSLDVCDNVLQLKEIEQELISQGIIKAICSRQKKKSKSINSLNCSVYEIDGFKVLVGKNNYQNELLLDAASRTDLWLHVKDYHSSHVIIKCGGDSVNKNTILVAAEICAYYSEVRNGSKIQVDACQRKFVKKPPASRPGSVIYSGHETYVVTPNKHEEFSLKL